MIPGWHPIFRDAFEALGEQQLVPVRVAAELRGAYQVLHEGQEIPAKLAGKLRHDAQSTDALPAVGDWVAVAPPGEEQAHAVIHHVLPRRTKFSRRAAGRRAVEQIIATNIDTVFLVSSLEKRLRPRTLERYLALAKESGARPVVVLSKADLHDDPTAAVKTMEESSGGAPVIAISMVGKNGLDALAAYLPAGDTGALLGMSGAGKSTLVNAWCGSDVKAIGDVRASDGRGRHTTTYRHLVPLPWGAFLIDTPGMRELQLWDGGETLETAFTDIAEVAKDCRFANCTHRAEPGCAVRTAIEEGTLDPARLASFHKLEAEKAAAAATRPTTEKIATRRRKGASKKRDNSQPDW